MTTPLYVFDLDEALMDGNSAMIWNEFLVEKGLANEPSFLNEERRLMTLYVQGILDEDIYLEFATRSLANKTYQEVCALLEECINRKVLSKIFPHLAKRSWLSTTQGQPMVIISAIVSFIPACVAKRLNIPNVVGIELMESSGQYSAKILGLPSHPHGKVVSLNEWLEQHGPSHNHSQNGADSINDLPQYEVAERPHLVNPHERLSARLESAPWRAVY
ncbi:Phosphoserine phosphatase [Vibrio chagasii]|uniref:HAD-IB family hydrolase n=1 Tax=Vibrio chagasii TaxID=170679 RepID=UPI00336F9FB1|nr:Phosphoserine phosphatase [Vibrio chagasii]CAH7115790.1 Phosphoserine phosphatase [Vibrio chagasii]CAH7421215.1 Phosphoserine phosphatase [Vibrio chagasii]